MNAASIEKKRKEALGTRLIWYNRKSFSGKFVKQINVVKNEKKEE